MVSVGIPLLQTLALRKWPPVHFAGLPRSEHFHLYRYSDRGQIDAANAIAQLQQLWDVTSADTPAYAILLQN
jgi:hypothetical protein